MLGIFSSALTSVIKTFGETVTFKGDGSLSLEVRASFSNIHSRVDLQTMVEVQSERPHILVRLSDFSPHEIKNRDQFVIRSKTYLVNNVEIDGEGGAKVYLYEQ